MNGAFTGFRVPSGVERIVVRFTPPGFWWGVAALVAAAGALVTVATKSRVRGRNLSSPS